MTTRSLVLALILTAPSLEAQALLPSHFGHWTASGTVQSAAPLPEEKIVFIESGLEGAESRSYSNGTAAITVITYRFHDSSGAYEAYTYLLHPMGTAVGAAVGASAAVATNNGGLTRVGNVVIVADPTAAIDPSELDVLSREVDAKADKTPPPIPSYLPARDRIPGTERYALGPAAFRAALASVTRQDYAGITDEVGFNSGAEAMFARYRTPREDAALLLIEYPTPQLAGLHWKHLQQALPTSARQHETSIERKGSLLAIVLSPSSSAYAARLREAVNYETKVTWNEPSHTITDPPITSVLAKIIIATGAFMLVAIVFGVAFGGVRVLLKNLFPGKVFDRPEQMDVLQLGLSGKRINSRDFY